MKVSKEQAEHFRTVVHFYGCSAEESDLMRAAYEADQAGAALCFAALAAHVELVTAREIEPEHTLTGVQFLKLGVVAKAMEALRDAE